MARINFERLSVRTSDVLREIQLEFHIKPHPENPPNTPTSYEITLTVDEAEKALKLLSEVEDAVQYLRSLES